MLCCQDCKYVCIVFVELDVKFNLVCIYDVDGVVQVVCYLVSFGYIKIVYIYGLKLFCFVYECLCGFWEGLVEFFLEFDLDLIFEVGYIFEFGVCVVDNLFLCVNWLIVFFVGNDEMVIGIYMFVCKFGLFVFEDLLIVGFDDMLMVV